MKKHLALSNFSSLLKWWRGVKQFPLIKLIKFGIGLSDLKDPAALEKKILPILITGYYSQGIELICQKENREISIPFY